MKRFFILALAISVGFFGCKEDDNGGSPNGPDQPNPNFANPFLDGTNIQTDFTGRITDMSGNPVSGAMVSIGSSYTTTDSRGFYQIQNAQVDRGFALIRITANNYFEQYRNLKPRDAEMNFVDITLLNLAYTSAFNAPEGGEIAIVGGANVTFPANGVVDAEGNPYSGQVVIASTYLDPTDVSLPLYIPGSLAAVDAEGQGVGMITFGMVGLEMIGSGGQPLQLAEGSTAVIEFPVPDELLGNAPDEIPLWSFDETVGIWYEEGSAIKVGNIYKGEVSHFSFWNCDIAFNTAYLQGTVVLSGANTALSNLYVRAIRPNGQYAQAAVAEDGHFGGIVPAGEELTLVFYTSPCGGTPIYAMEVPALSGNLDLGEIAVTVDISVIHVSGILEDCDGNTLAGLVVIVDADEYTDSYGVTGADGSFSISLLCLTSGTLTVDVFDFDNVLEINGLEVEYDVNTSDVYDMGMVSFCEAEELEMYFTYNEGDFEFLFPTVNMADSANCLSFMGLPGANMEAAIYMDMGAPTGLGPAPVCSVEGGMLYHYYPGSQDYYQAVMSNYAFDISELEMDGGTFTLLKGTYTTDVAVSGYVDGAPINYNAVATGSFRYIQ